MSGDRTYQAALIAAINAEMGGLGLSRRQMLARAGLSENTMERVFRLQRDLNVTQIEAMAEAMGVTPEHIARRASEWRGRADGDDPATASVTSHLSEDPRTLIRYLMDHPDNDGTLQTRLGELRRESGASSRTLAAVEHEMVNNRRTELARALDALPPANSA
jgi:lambda repressor-like predicted transcriptional regulator